MSVEREPRLVDLVPATMLAGARAILPLALGVSAFGTAYGVTVVESSMEDWVGVLASVVILAGAAQLAVVNLFDDGAPWFIVVGTALVINARLLMYSGALAPSFAEYPHRWRLFLAHLITDQSTVTSLLFDDRVRDPLQRVSYYIGAGGTMAILWLVGTVVGVTVGATVPPELQLGFAVPLMFVALLVPTVKDRATATAAIVGFATTLLFRDAPLNTGLLIGAGAGMVFGMVARLRWDGAGGLDVGVNGTDERVGE